MILSVVIVNYSTRKLLLNCLSSLFASLKEGLDPGQSEVIVVDNGSSDASPEAVKERYPKVRLIENLKNYGFAKANNQGIKEAHGQYLLLLNSDTEVRVDTIKNLYGKIDRKREVAVVGGKLVGSDGRIQPSAGYFPSLVKVFFWMTFLDDLPFLNGVIKPYHVGNKSFYQKNQAVDWVTGACILVRREVVENVGLLDEKIFMYGEEMEWCYRIRKAGYEIVYTNEAEIIHLKGASSIGVNAGIIEEFKSICYFYRKHKPRWQYPIVKAILRFGALLRLILFGIIGKYSKRATLYAKAFQVVG